MVQNSLISMFSVVKLMNVLRVPHNKAIKDETFFRLDVDKNFLSFFLHVCKVFKFETSLVNSVKESFHLNPLKSSLKMCHYIILIISRYSSSCEVTSFSFFVRGFAYLQLRDLQLNIEAPNDDLIND